MEFFILSPQRLCLETLSPALAHNGALMIGEIVVIIEPVHLVEQCTGVLAGFCSTQHQGAYADPAYQPLLAIFFL